MVTKLGLSRGQAARQNSPLLKVIIQVDTNTGTEMCIHRHTLLIPPSSTLGNHCVNTMREERREGAISHSPSLPPGIKAKSGDADAL